MWQKQSKKKKSHVVNRELIDQISIFLEHLLTQTILYEKHYIYKSFHDPKLLGTEFTPGQQYKTQSRPVSCSIHGVPADFDLFIFSMPFWRSACWMGRMQSSSELYRNTGRLTQSINHTGQKHHCSYTGIAENRQVVNDLKFSIY